MKTFFKRVFTSLVVSFFILTLVGSYVSNRLVDELEQMSKIHYENSYLTDAAVICMQLFFLDPTLQNKKTCLQIEDKINHNKNELNNFTLALLYLDYLEKY